MATKSILLIDDHSLFRRGLSTLIYSELNDIEILESVSLEEAIRIQTKAVNLILLDIQLQGLSGLDGTSLLRSKWPESAIIIISADDSSETIQLAQEKGASHFISKGNSADEILQIITQALENNAIGANSHSSEFKTSSVSAKPQLTPRQYEVLNLLCKGLSNKMIGRQLQLSENTVRCHVQVLLAALNASNRAEAAFTARRIGLVA